MCCLTYSSPKETREQYKAYITKEYVRSQSELEEALEELIKGSNNKICGSASLDMLLGILMISFLTWAWQENF